MKKLATGLGVTLGVAVIAAVYLWHEIRLQREQNAEAMVRVTALESSRLTGSTVTMPAHDGAQSAEVGSVSGAQAGQGGAEHASGDRSPGRGANSLLAQIGQMQNTPEVQEFQRVMMRQMLEDEFPDLAREMNLGPEKAGKLLDLLAKHRVALGTDSLRAQPGAAQDAAARAEMARSRAERERTFQAELKSLLGDSYPKWGEYERAAAERQRDMYVRMGKEELRNAISSGSIPLTDAQFEYLNGALDAEQRRIDQESGSRGMSLQQQVQRLPETNRRLAEVAAAHLNPQQLASYRRYLEQQAEMMGMIGVLGSDR